MTSSATILGTWLAHCERLHPHKVDMGLDRVRLVAQRLNLSFVAPVVMVAGTNGKGSTCAMLEAIGLQAGFRVGLYSKPHLVHFEERCRVQGLPVQAEALIPHFEAVEQARAELGLTYFEFTSLVIMRLLSQTPLDLVILEVGLGGRLDAVNVIDATCAVITSIDLDHTELLGPNREAIGFEKAGIMRAGCPAVISDPMPPESVIQAAQTVGADLWRVGHDFSFSGDKQQWSWRGRQQRFNALAYPALRGANQLLNASGALAVFEVLREQLPITAQAVRQGLAWVDLPGRFQIVPGQPTLVLDVAHNPHAVAALAQNLDQMGFFPATHAIFGGMADKALDVIITRMAHLVDHWHFTDLPSLRAAKALDLQRLHAALRLPTPGDVTIHPAPHLALEQAVLRASPTDRIVVFGSFLSVGGVLQHGLPKLTAKHVH